MHINLFLFLQEHNGKDKEKITQLQDAVVKQTMKYRSEVEKIKNEMTVSSNVCLQLYGTSIMF